jgi:hypothetical protein
MSKVRLLGVSVGREDAKTLIGKLLAFDSPPAHQAAKTILYGLESGESLARLSHAERDAILATLQRQPPPGLEALRSALLIERSQRDA